MKEKSGFGLGNIFPNMIDLMNHLAKYSNLTDEDVVKMSSTEHGLDAEAYLTTLLERDICKGAVDEILKKSRNF